MNEGSASLREDLAAQMAYVGASAGLNLVADRYTTAWETGDGDPLLVAPLPRVIERVGFDLRPLDVRDEADARWLRACVWPGQGEREKRLLEAVAAFRALQSTSGGPTLSRTAAREVPDRLPLERGGSFAIVYQTVVRDYLSRDERHVYETGMRSWLGARRAGSALWVELEVTDSARSGGPSAAITAHGRGLRGPGSWTLAFCEPHPVRLDIQDAQVADLRAVLLEANARISAPHPASGPGSGNP